MPRIPQIQQQTNISGAGLGPGPQGNQGELAVAAAAMRLGEDVAFARRYEQQKREEQAQVAASGEVQSARAHWLTELQNRSNAAEPGAPGFTPSILEAFDADMATRLEKAATPTAKQYMRQRLQDVRLGIQQDAMRFESGAIVDHKLGQLDQALNDARTAVEFRPDDFATIAGELGDAIDLSGLPAQMRVSTAEKARDALASSAVAGMVRADPRGTLAELNNEQSANPAIAALAFDDRQRLRNAAESEIKARDSAARVASKDRAAATVLAAYEHDGPEAGGAALERALASAPADLRADLRAQVNSELAALRTQRREAHADELAAVETALGDGTAGLETEGMVDDLYRSNALSASERGNYLGAIARVETVRNKDQATVAVVQAAIANGEGLDPANDKHREAVDTLFRSQVGDREPTDPIVQLEAITLARDTNILPESMQSWARISMLSGTPEQATQGAAFYARAKAADPASFAWADDPNMDSFATQLNAMLAAGVAPQQAYDVAHKNVYETTAAEQDLMTDAYRDEAKNNQSALRGTLDDEFDTWFTSVPPTPNALQAEYNELVRSYYMSSGGNIDVARQQASDNVLSLWGVSAVNGARQIMKYPPERRGLTPDLVRADLLAVAKEAGYAGAPEGVQLSPTEDTERTQGQEWSILVTDEFGGLDTLRDQQNRPVLYGLPLGNDFQRARDALAAENIEKARQERERWRAQSGTAGAGLEPF